MVKPILSDVIESGLGSTKKYAGLTDELRQQKNDPPLSPSGPYTHGENGIFYMPQSNDALVSTIIAPRGGVLDTIPVLATDPYDANTSQMFGSRLYTFDTIMTGLTEGDIEDFDNQPTDDCADGPEGGFIKLCTLINTMARYRGSTKEVSLFRAGTSFDRLDEMPHRLLNAAPGLQAFFGTPDAMPEQNAIIMNEMAYRMFTTLGSFRRFLSRRVWTGTPANNSGERRDLLGLEEHINAGNKVDVFSGQLCDAADSIVLDFGGDAVDGTGRDIVEYLEAAEYANRVNAERMGLSPISGVLVMRPSLFEELTGVMPIKQYQEVLAALQTQQNADQTRIMINATDAQNQRTQFRNSMMLPLNGRMIPVVVDDGIPETTNAEDGSIPSGTFESDIYFLPLTVMGGMPATFFEFFQHANPQADAILARIASNAFTFTSDGGLFRWHINVKNGCVKLNFEMSPWLKMKFPMTAWRVTNIRYTPTLRERSPYPDSDYFANGGVVSSSGQFPNTKYYPMWDPTNPFSV